MWAWRYEDEISAHALRRVELPCPEPGPGDVVLRMRAAAVNYRDLAIASGRYHVGVSPPLVPLSDGAGEVVAVGPGVTQFGVGDLVCPVYLPDWIQGPIRPQAARRRLGGPTDGVLAEFVRVRQDEAVRAPGHLSAEAASALPVAYVTAWHTLFAMGGLTRGDKLAVQGSGGVSTAAVQLAAAMGLQVLSVTRRREHVETLRRLGAADVLVVADADWGRAAGEALGGADAVLTVAGGGSPGQGILATRVGGRVLIVGYAGGVTAELDIFEAIRHAVTLHVATAGHRTDFEALAAFMEAHRLTPHLGCVLAGDDPKPAFAALAAGGIAGKVVLALP
jgi:NADPH:quinone reductase-like Zn-dependent oxidoreductase